MANIIGNIMVVGGIIAGLWANAEGNRRTREREAREGRSGR